MTGALSLIGFVYEYIRTVRHLAADWQMCIHIHFIISFFGHKVKVFFSLSQSFLKFLCRPAVFTVYFKKPCRNPYFAAPADRCAEKVKF